MGYVAQEAHVLGYTNLPGQLFQPAWLGPRTNDSVIACRKLAMKLCECIQSQHGPFTVYEPSEAEHAKPQS
jgi:hypothetical protein